METKDYKDMKASEARALSFNQAISEIDAIKAQIKEACEKYLIADN